MSSVNIFFDLLHNDSVSLILLLLSSSSGILQAACHLVRLGSAQRIAVHAGPPFIFEYVFFFTTFLSFADGSKRLVTGGMGAAGVLAICLKWRKARSFL